MAGLRQLRRAESPFVARRARGGRPRRDLGRPAGGGARRPHRVHGRRQAAAPALAGHRGRGVGRRSRGRGARTRRTTPPGRDHGVAAGAARPGSAGAAGRRFCAGRARWRRQGRAPRPAPPGVVDRPGRQPRPRRSTAAALGADAEAADARRLTARQPTASATGGRLRRRHRRRQAPPAGAPAPTRLPAEESLPPPTSAVSSERPRAAAATAAAAPTPPPAAAEGPAATPPQPAEPPHSRAQTAGARASRRPREPVEARRLEQHFVYNSLNAIASLIRTDPARARELLVGFADLSRATDRPADAPSTLGHELAVVRDYLALEQARFGKRLRVEIDVDRALHDRPRRAPARARRRARRRAARHRAPRPGRCALRDRPTRRRRVRRHRDGRRGEPRVLALTTHVTV